LWRTADGSLLHELQSHGGSTTERAFSPANTWLAAGGGDVWQVAGGEHLYTLPELETLTVQEDEAMPERTGYVAFSPDESTLASSSVTKIGLWSMADGALLHTLAGHGEPLRWLAFSPDGATLASGGSDGTLRLWRVADGTLLHTFESQDGRRQAAFSPDGRLLVTVSTAGEVQIWRTSDWSLLHTLEREEGSVNSLLFAPAGDVLALGGSSSVELWRVSDGVHLQTLDGGGYFYLDRVAFGPDGRSLAGAFSVPHAYRTAEGDWVEAAIGTVLQIWSLEE
jgi:WD40 repeat protein